MPEPTKATTQDAADPSMEEILASIRRILNEDETSAAAEPPPEPQPQAEADDDVLVLDRSMLVTPADEAPLLAEHAATDHPAADHRAEAAEPAAGAAAALPPPDLARTEGVTAPAALLAPEAAAAAASSVDGLLRTLAASRSTQVHRGGPTLEDLVRAEMRPLLKEWLDSHLPDLVERLVRAEIERVVGRAVS
ncbi:DUF2497 domain-containing protein [Rhodopila sp.]|jgi:cell pole-organizing protein PopZ|uniref:DUF2497 domain-containing protein n=1 Tax=Rhodopila sp. TaxID=2480087 RepID=UPI002B72D3B2|nr:DUF2497 domain-containing protein [Rhodopila sp.]HVZ07605.1 DUF2497 domain-containing protein [Rhodopila sp.]